MTSEIV